MIFGLWLLRVAIDQSIEDVKSAATLQSSFYAYFIPLLMMECQGSPPLSGVQV